MATNSVFPECVTTGDNTLFYKGIVYHVCMEQWRRENAPLAFVRTYGPGSPLAFACTKSESPAQARNGGALFQITGALGVRPGVKH